MKNWNKPEIEEIEVTMTLSGSKPNTFEQGTGSEAGSYYVES